MAIEKNNVTRKKRKSTKKKLPPESGQEFGTRDRVLVTYRTKWFDLVNVPGIILRANRNSGYPFKIKLEDTKGKVINLGHDDDGGEAGSGPFIYCDKECITMVERFVAKRLEGEIKTLWKIGDKFMPKKNFGKDQYNDDEVTGVVETMTELCANKVMTVSAILNICDKDWIIDSNESHAWLPSWIDAIHDKQ